MKRALLAAVVVAVASLGCSPGGPRALVLVDGSPEGARVVVAARAEAFASRAGRPVRVLRVEGGASAVELAARGEAEVAVVPAGTPLGDLVTSGRGRDVGALTAGELSLRVLEVDGKLHPKVDGDGARALAAHMASP